jgi:hypothetical protein
MAAAQVELKKPASAYWLWLGENRDKIVAALGHAKGSDVAKKGGEMWKVLPNAAKLPFEKKAKEQKDAYEKFLATDAGKKALEEKKAAAATEKADNKQKEEAKLQKLKEKEEMRSERACKAAVKAVEKDDALKKPQTAYWLWLADNRDKIVAELGSGKGSEVAKKGGEMWKDLRPADKLPYEKKAKEQKDVYDKYIASPEGQAALKAFKDGVSAAKEEFKPKEAPALESPPAPEVGTKRKAKEAEEAPAEAGAVAKKARGRPAKIQTARLGA